MKLGRFTKRVEIQEATETNTDGDVSLSWSTVRRSWAEPVSQSSREFYAAKTVNADITHMWRMHYYGDLTPKHRLLFDGRTFNILSAENVIERGVEHLVQTKEVL